MEYVAIAPEAGWSVMYCPTSLIVINAECWVKLDCNSAGRI